MGTPEELLEAGKISYGQYEAMANRAELQEIRNSGARLQAERVRSEPSRLPSSGAVMGKAMGCVQGGACKYTCIYSSNR